MRVCVRLTTSQNATAPKPSFDSKFGAVNIKFDDSVIVDTQTEKQMMLNEIAAGVLPAWMFLATFYSKTEEEAKEMIGTTPIDEGF